MDQSVFTISTKKQLVRTYREKDEFKQEDLKADLKKRTMNITKSNMIKVSILL